MKLTFLTLTVAALIAASPPAFAQGVSSESPGQQMQDKGSKGEPGASYHAPGQEMQRKEKQGKSSTAPGASGYAPGHSTTGSAVRERDTTKKSK